MCALQGRNADRAGQQIVLGKGIAFENGGMVRVDQTDGIGILQHLGTLMGITGPTMPSGLTAMRISSGAAATCET